MSSYAFFDINTLFANDKQLKREQVAKVEQWQNMQPHLPPVRHPIEVALALCSRSYNNEMAKQLIDYYYTIRPQCPEFFANRDPFRRELQQAMDTCLVTALPNLTPDGYIVFYIRILDRNTSKFNFNEIVKLCDMVATLTLTQRGCENGCVGILDVEGVTMTHVLKCNLLNVKKSADYLQKAAPLRLNSIHLVNGISIIDKIVAIIQHFFQTELFNKVHVHFGDNATIFKYVPKDILPIECGGLSFSATDCFKNITRKTIEKHAEFFKEDETRIVDESRRPNKPKSVSGFHEVEGTFKNLEID